MHDKPTTLPPFRQPSTPPELARNGDHRHPTELEAQRSADRRRSRRQGVTHGTAAQLRWFAWALAALVGLCLLFAAWVWMEILRAGL